MVRPTIYTAEERLQRQKAQQRRYYLENKERIIARNLESQRKRRAAQREAKLEKLNIVEIPVEN